MMEDTKPTVIFVASVGHSGSTLLDMVLGTHDMVFSVGELRQSDRFFDREKTEKEFKNCTCGVRATECPVWSHVSRDALVSLGKFRRYNKKELFKSFLSDRKLENNIDFMEYELTLRQIYSELIRETGNKVFVDSSKNPHHLIALGRAYRSGAINLLVVRLEKDIPALMWSAKKEGRNPYRKVPEFIMHRYLTDKLITKFDIPWTYVTYRSLINYLESGSLPATMVYSIYQNTRISYDFVMANDIVKLLQKTTHHNIGGNGMRFDEIDKIQYDDAWRSNLTWFEQKVGKTCNSLLKVR